MHKRPGLRLWHALALAIGMWAGVTVARVILHRDHGLHAQYFSQPTFSGSIAAGGIDREISTAQVYRRFNAAPPDAFSVQWSGYLQVDRRSDYTFSTTSDNVSRVYIDRELVVFNPGGPQLTSALGHIQLERGAHLILVQCAHNGGRFAMDWSWTRQGELEPVPDWALSTTPAFGAALVARALSWLWWILGGAAIALGAFPWLQSGPFTSGKQALVFSARVALFVMLGWFFVSAATKHSVAVNTFKARADQSGYLWDAEQVYANVNGRVPPVLIGGRARMPIYAGYLSLFYTPLLTDAEFFAVAKVWNIRLAIVLIGILAIVFAWHLPPLISTNLSLIVAFGYFVFKAGYAQPELLFYFLFFVAFIACWHLLRRRERGRGIAWGCLGGTAAGLAYLTKALVPPFIILFLGTLAIDEVFTLARRSRRGSAQEEAKGTTWRRSALQDFAWRAAAGLAFGVSFLLVVYPYIANSKRILGAYFYNLNTTHYIWYDSGSEARNVTMPSTDQDGRIHMAAEQLPTARTYWNTHSLSQILGRFKEGFKDMAGRSFTAYAFWKYLLLYVGFALAVIVANRRAFFDLVSQRAAVVWFLVLYAALYLTGTAFFVPISGTGSMRFLLTHAAPFFFVLSYLFARPPFSHTTWVVRRWQVTPTHFHGLLFAVLCFDLTFTLWPRLMSTFGGF